MVAVCLISAVGCNQGEKKKPTDKKTPTVNKVTGAITTDIAANAEFINSDNTSSVSFTGNQSTAFANIKTPEKTEIYSKWEDAYKLVNMKGESDSAAVALRSKILTSKDNLNISGTKYYVSSVHGNDSFDGLSPEKPIKTISQIRQLNLEEGDAVLFERGSVFRLTGSFTLKNGVTYAAYGKGDKPAIYGSSRNYADLTLWQPYNEIKNIWIIESSFPGDVGNIVFNHGELASEAFDYVLLLSKNGDFYYDSVGNKLYLYYDKGNPGRIFKDIEISPRFVLLNIPTGGHDITIDNIALKYSGNFAIRGLELDNVNITNCEIAWIGGAWQPNGVARYGNGIEVGGIQNSVWKNNWIYQIFDSGITFQLNTNTVKNNYFTENLFEYCGMSAFEWWQSTKDGVIDGIIEDVYFTDNISRFPGYGWSDGMVRGGRHIQGPFQRQDYPNMKNFVFKNNIFDTALGTVYCWVRYSENSQGNDCIVTDNTYYQRAGKKDVGNIYGYAPNRQEGTYIATDQASFETAIGVMDKNPKLVKWLK